MAFLLSAVMTVSVGSAVFAEEESSAPSASNEILPLAEGDTWGYNEDGSIWWEETVLVQVAADEIREGEPYVIAGNARLNVMTGTAANDTMLAGARPGAAGLFDYAVWYFEDTGSGYHIYTEDTPGDRKYLCLNGESLTLTGQAESASSFTAEQAVLEEYTECVILQSGGQYLNANGDDGNYFKGWAGWKDPDSGSCIQLLKVSREGRQTANRLETTTSPNTVINLFDYWITGETDPDNVNTDSASGLLERGINAGHALKFTRNGDDGRKINTYVGVGKGVRPGIVANVLGKDGYPELSGDQDVNATAAKDSLAYLFDPNREADGKRVYRNAGGLLTVDENGYYSFNSRRQMAEYDETANVFCIYDKPGAMDHNTGERGQFFPLNRAPQIMSTASDEAVLNHFFGVGITTRFLQQYGGHVSTGSHAAATTFDFTGDDDVWIFIDGVLVGDVGGIHDACSVSLNFATGDVVVTTQDGVVCSGTTLRDCYRNAGLEGTADWSKTAPNTFADNTTHTLKFYYLERGNYASNMDLKYNLTAIPQTAITKIDQYGDAVPGAEFAVYAADTKYQMLSAKGGSVVTEEAQKNGTYDRETGTLYGADGTELASALYVGTTNQQGQMVFLDQDGLPYSIKELQALFGDQFILREIAVPEGYRVVAKDVHLEFWKGGSQLILKCENTTDSGSRAASALKVTATDVLYLRRDYEGDIAETVDGNPRKIQYYTGGDEGATGTLFAVIFKYVGPTDSSGKATGKGLEKSESWAPLYGSETVGYTLVSDKTGLPAALEAAKKELAYSNDIVFQPSTSSSTMEMMLNHLPGHAVQYYRMLDDDKKTEAQFTVGYYWTDQDSLEKADVGNTYRVFAYADTLEAGGGTGEHYSGFSRTFGANIQVPNLINKIIVQKMDRDGEKGTRINGARFAIYRVEQSEKGEIRYFDNQGHLAAPGSAMPDPDTGVIMADGGKVVEPVATDDTRDYRDGIHVGTAEFGNLAPGEYVIKEIDAPDGYKLNPTDIMVLVTEDTIYANAGTEDDGVVVGRGPGYLVAPLHQFASEGQIDNTMTWIYAQMKISGVSTRFSDVLDPGTSKAYLAQNYTGETVKSDAEARATTYLKYAARETGTVFNYIRNEGRYGPDDEMVDQGRRLFTTVGWPYYEIYQDYEYGLANKDSCSNYEKWSKKELSHLFSRSTYIRVTDPAESHVAVQKVDAKDSTKQLSGAQFRLYRINPDDGKTKEYYGAYDTVTGAVSWGPAESARVVVTGDTGGQTEQFTNLPDGIYYLEETAAPKGYRLPSSPVKLTVGSAALTLTDEAVDVGYSVSRELDVTTNLYTYTVTVPNQAAGEEEPTTGTKPQTTEPTAGTEPQTAESTQVLPPEDTPPTGDTGSGTVWAAMLVLSVLGLAGAWAVDRRKNMD